MNYKDVLVKLAFVLLGAAITYYISKEQLASESELRFLDFDISQENFSSGKIGLEDDLTVLIGGDTMEKYGRFTLKGYNFTDRNYKDIPIYIELFNTDGSDVEVVSEYAFGEENLTDHITRNDSLTNSINKGAFRVSYQIDVVNSIGEEIKPFFTLQFYIKGALPDQYSINVMHEGLDDQHINWEDVYQRRTKWYESTWFIIMCAIIFLVVYIFLLNKMSRHGDEKYRNRKIDFIAQELNIKRKKYEKMLAEDDFGEEILDHIYYLEELYDWKNESFLRKLIWRSKKPELYEEEEDNKD